MSRVLVVDDELSMRELLEIFFLKEGHDVDTAADGATGVQRLIEEEYDLVITDLRMPGTHGMIVLERAIELQPDTPVIVMTAYASTDTAIKAMKIGAYDYFTKPFKLDEVKVVIEKALERRALVQENRKLRQALDARDRFQGIIGRSQPMRDVFNLIKRVARTRTNVLILGESGTGKELVARAIHTQSERAGKPFLVINCAAIPENLLESELFGHRRGTFTGATSDREGLFQAADGGTLLLDEIGEMPLGMQVKLLRVLQERKVKAVGDLREVPVDVRVIAATNRDLAAEVRAGRFREDLYYRLNVISIELPSLRDRPSDIPLLAHHFLRKYAVEFDKPVRDIDPEAMQILLAHPFSGNVRELENLIERAVALEDGNRITPRSLPHGLRTTTTDPEARPPEAVTLPPSGIDLEDVVGNVERRLIEQALAATNGRKKEAARLLGISFRSLRYRLEKLNMKADGDD
ncbi:MAG: sigma-54 dependent transcriptional regulator [bacterium]|nr:sigma-54-dependent Fis family transcriptional regulator [Myxococcales bacterium]MCB9553554.1 sigma-54-dependent Fis family transcriptional regulator [Myxococcales bacterium]